MQLPHRLTLKRSRRLAALLLLLHLAALGSVIPLAIPLWLRLSAAVLVAVSAAASIRRHGMLAAPASVRTLILLADGSVQGETRVGSRFTADVAPQSTVFPWLAVVLLKMPGRRRTVPVVLLPDSVQPDEWRSLRAWLRWNAAREVSGA